MHGGASVDCRPRLWPRRKSTCHLLCRGPYQATLLFVSWSRRAACSLHEVGAVDERVIPARGGSWCGEAASPRTSDFPGATRRSSKLWAHTIEFGPRIHLIFFPLVVRPATQPSMTSTFGWLDDQLASLLAIKQRSRSHAQPLTCTGPGAMDAATDRNNTTNMSLAKLASRSDFALLACNPERWWCWYLWRLYDGV